MKLAIMQPYFLPYIGYFQLINCVDTFVVYDNIEYTKKGWINRNRFLQNGKEALFSIPLRKDSDFLHVNQRIIADSYNPDKILSKILNTYRKAPQFINVAPLIEEVFLYSSINLFDFIHFSLSTICKFLDIKTKIVNSSTINIDHNLKSKEKILAICRNLEVSSYINSIGGRELYLKSDFEEHNINLYFLKSNEIKYKQFDNEFVPWLSIIDMLMFCKIDDIKVWLDNYELE
jgi:hypothetical protein